MVPERWKKIRFHAMRERAGLVFQSASGSARVVARSGELRHNRVRRRRNGANGFHGAEPGHGLNFRSLSALQGEHMTSRWWYA